MPRISTEVRKKIIEDFQLNMSQRNLARNYNISLCAVQKLIKRYKLTGKVDDLPKSGRPPKTTMREQRCLIIDAKKDPYLTARQLHTRWNTQNPISIETAKKILQKYGLFGRICAKKPLLSTLHRKTRLRWCRAYKEFTSSQWNEVIFSDECRIGLINQSKKVVRRPINSRYNQRYTMKSLKFQGGSIMVWGAIKSTGERIIKLCPPQLDSAGYQNILNDSLPSIYESTNIFMQDGASCHRSKSTMQFLEDKGIMCLSDWPPQSPDLNIIEPLWGILKNSISAHKPRNEEDLWRFCQEEWQKIPISLIQKLYASILRRIREVIRLKGYSGNY